MGKLAGFIEDVGHWKEMLGLQDWEIAVVKAEAGELQENSPAHVTALWEYKQARIVASPRRIGKLDPEYRSRVAMHELLHCIVSPMRDYAVGEASEVAIKLEEMVVTHLERVALGAAAAIQQSGPPPLAPPSLQEIREAIG